MSTCELVRPTHLQRQAVIYVRQSSPHQVLTHHESRQLQYSLRQRAIELGWRGQDIRVVDCDLGRSARSAAGRRGFQQLVADVTLGKVGIIIAYDATRLARNCSDWYPLLDTCGYRDCLIGDRDGVYDPASLNGRVLLGFKGQMSELELHMLRGRLTAGILSKAQRGELALTLPIGLVRDGSGQVLKNPNREVQDRVRLVFQTFLQRRSAAQVVRALRDRHLNLPRRDRFGDVAWRAPNEAGVCSILKNPAYAGAFVYGRTRCAARRGQGALRMPVPQEQWRVCLRGKYPAYIDWETYHRIQAMLRDNYAEYRRNQTRGTPRPGKALLHGLVFCGECGHKMMVQYKRGTRYVCNHLYQQFQEPLCQLLPADPIDRCVVGLFMAAFSAVELDLHAAVTAKVRHERRQMLGASRQQLQRLRYQASLAERQFNQSDPDNRLVTAELERRWEQALAALKEAEAELPQDAQQRTDEAALDASTRRALENVGRNLPQLWPRLSAPRKKQLLRCLIEKVILCRVRSDTVRIRVVWKGGAVSSVEIPVPVRTVAALSRGQEMQQRLLALSRQGHSDGEVARRLTRAGFRSPSRNAVLPSTVRELRLRHRVLLKPGHPRARRTGGYLTVAELGRKLGIVGHWIYDRIHTGTIQISKDVVTQMYLFPDHPRTLTQFRKLMSGKVPSLRI
jgi:DNA invertase Pin-like site-specific DNA recombinase